jgi:hypothetical protein
LRSSACGELAESEVRKCESEEKEVRIQDSGFRITITKK